MEETVAIQSEISMSVVTEQWQRVRQVHQGRRRSILRWWPWPRNATPTPYQLMVEQARQEQQEKGRFPLGKYINPEPVIFLFCCAFSLLKANYPLFLFWARCVEMFDSFDRMDNLTSNATEFCAKIATLKNHRALDMVEADLAQKTIYLQVFSTVPALLSAPFFGAWSDYHGRRPPFLLCQLGVLLYCALTCIASFFYQVVNVYTFLVPAQLCFGIFSGIMVFTMSSTIVIDECRQKLAQSRSGIPTRIAVACAIQFGGFLTGNVLASALLSLCPGPEAYSLAFLISTALALLSLVYTFFWVRESHFPGLEEGGQLAQQFVPPSFSTHLRNYTLGAFEVLVKKREAWIRLCLFLTLGFMFIEFMSSDDSLRFLVLKQYDWTDTEYSILLLFRAVLNALGTILLPLLLRFVAWPGSESFLLIGSILASGLSSALFAFAHTVPQIYALSLFSLLTAAISPGFRTILARFVAKAETGRLFAFVTLVFNFCPLVSKALFNTFFWATMQWWPALVFLLLALIHGFVLLGQVFVHLLMLPIWRAPVDSAEAGEDGTNSTTEDGSEEGGSSGHGSSISSDRSMAGGSTTAEEEE